MTNELKNLIHINVWKKGDQRAIHKPLLILMRLAAITRGEDRLISYNDIAEPLEKLIRDYGPTRKSYHPENPIWYLRSDGFWELTQDKNLESEIAHRTKKSGCPTQKQFRELNPQLGFDESTYEKLKDDQDQIQEITKNLLYEFFPESLHEDILDAIGMQWTIIVNKRKRDPKFREEILRLYERRCAICGFDGRLLDRDLGIEAAHIKMHAYGGADDPSNGFALCSFHHKMFDFGAIGLTEDRRVLVSSHVLGGDQVKINIVDFSGQQIKAPLDIGSVISSSNIDWHTKNIFKEPERPLFD